MKLAITISYGGSYPGMPGMYHRHRRPRRAEDGTTGGRLDANPSSGNGEWSGCYRNAEIVSLGLSAHNRTI